MRRPAAADVRNLNRSRIRIEEDAVSYCNRKIPTKRRMPRRASSILLPAAGHVFELPEYTRTLRASACSRRATRRGATTGTCAHPDGACLAHRPSSACQAPASARSAGIMRTCTVSGAAPGRSSGTCRCNVRVYSGSSETWPAAGSRRRPPWCARPQSLLLLVVLPLDALRLLVVRSQRLEARLRDVHAVASGKVRPFA